MQTEIQTKVKISVSEIKKILAEKFCLYHDFELEIVNDFVVESEAVKEENSEWVDVPNNWDKPYCPVDHGQYSKIDVQYRCGDTRYGVLASCVNYAEWIQEDHDHDIVKYRVVPAFS